LIPCKFFLCSNILIEELNLINTTNNATPERNNSRQCNQTRRNPTPRQRINGVIPESLEFGASLSTKTPQKMSLLENATAEIQNMISQCHGMPMKAYPIVNGKCAKCKQNTSFILFDAMNTKKDV